MRQKPLQSSVVILIVIVAVVIGVGGFLALSYLWNRPDAPPEAQVAEGYPLQVNGVLVMVQNNPNETVQLIGPAGPQIGQPVVSQPVVSQPDQTIQVQPESTNTPTPMPDQPVATAVPPTAVQPLPPPSNEPSVIFISYQVQPGDTLYSIGGQRIDSSISLMAKHGISSDDLVVGNVIQVPVGNPAYCPGYRPYAVEEADTAFSIARRFNMTLAELQQVNGLDANYTVYVTQILCVR